MCEFKLNIINKTTTTSKFYFFQGQATYGVASAQTSSSLGNGSLAPYESSGAVLTFAVDQKIYAGAQQLTAGAISSTPALLARDLSALAVSQSSAARPIGVEGSKNATKLSIAPIGLSSPYTDPAVAAGSFGIVTPRYVPSAHSPINCGIAVVNADYSVVLSNYVPADPLQTIQCGPSLIFYVTTGDYPEGSIIDYDSSISNAALCDFTTGCLSYAIDYGPDGKFSVSPGS